MSELGFVSPVAAGPLSTLEDTLSLADSSPTSKVLVRAGADTPTATYLSVPFGRSRETSDGTLVCGTRPDEWTLYAAPGRSSAVIEAIPDAGFVTIIDITHGRAMTRLSGPVSNLALAKLCNIDFAEDMVPDGAVFSAVVAEVPCDIVRNDQTGRRSYLLTCERSFGRYLFIALADAGTEFGLHPPQGWTLH